MRQVSSVFDGNVAGPQSQVAPVSNIFTSFFGDDEEGASVSARPAKVAGVETRPIGPITLRPRGPEGAPDWPGDAEAKVTVEKTGPDGRKRIETVHSKDVIELEMGMSTKPLERKQISSDDEEELRSPGARRADGTRESPALMDIEQLVSNPQAATGKEVFVLGAGGTGGLASDAAVAQGAKQVTWNAPPSKPPATEADPTDPTKQVPTAFGTCEDRIRELSGSGQAVPEELSKEYAGHIKKHRDAAKAEIEEINEMLQDLMPQHPENPAEEKKLAAEIDRLHRLKRSKETTAGYMTAETAGVGVVTDKASPNDVLSVKPDPEGSGKVLVTMISPIDGKLSTKLVDTFVNASGPDMNDPASAAAMCANIDKMEVIWEGNPPRPVGLQSVPAGVRVMGSAAWELRDKIGHRDDLWHYMKAVGELTTGGLNSDEHDLTDAPFNGNGLGTPFRAAKDAATAASPHAAADALAAGTGSASKPTTDEENEQLLQLKQAAAASLGSLFSFDN